MPTIFIAGGSTAAEDTILWSGWGSDIKPYFILPVNNRAASGASSRTFFEELRWKSLLDDVHEGDIALIQFGHNDGLELSRPVEASKQPLAGTGDETEEINGVTVRTFCGYLRYFANSIKEKGGIPIILSRDVSNVWTKDRTSIVDEKPLSVTFAELVGHELGEAHFVDGWNASKMIWNELGYSGTQEMFYDKIHTNTAGSELAAMGIVKEIIRTKQPTLYPLLSKAGLALGNV